MMFSTRGEAECNDDRRTNRLYAFLTVWSSTVAYDIQLFVHASGKHRQATCTGPLLFASRRDTLSSSQCQFVFRISGCLLLWRKRCAGVGGERVSRDSREALPDEEERQVCRPFVNSSSGGSERGEGERGTRVVRCAWVGCVLSPEKDDSRPLVPRSLLLVASLLLLLLLRRKEESISREIRIHAHVGPTTSFFLSLSLLPSCLLFSS